jgi:hypothetical protein
LAIAEKQITSKQWRRNTLVQKKSMDEEEHEEKCIK